MPNNIERSQIIEDGLNQPIKEFKPIKIEWDELWHDVEEYYKEDASDVIDTIANGSNVIVNSPCGAGKTKLLTLVIKGLAKKQGFIVGEKAGPDFHTMPLFEEYQYFHTFDSIITDVFPNASSEQKKLFILDEAANMGIEDFDNTEAIFRYLKDNNISFVLLNSAPQKKMRAQSASGMIEIASKVGFPLTIHEQKQKGYIPIEIVNKYLKSESIEPALLNFLIHPENDAFCSFRLFSQIVSEITSERILFCGESMRTLTQLRTYASDRWEIWMRQTLGGSKVALVRALTNLGVINSNHEWLIDSIKNYD